MNLTPTERTITVCIVEDTGHLCPRCLYEDSEQSRLARHGDVYLCIAEGCDSSYTTGELLRELSQAALKLKHEAVEVSRNFERVEAARMEAMEIRRNADELCKSLGC